MNGHEKILGIVQVVAGLKNTGDGEFFRENHLSQLVDCFFLFFALGVLQFFNAVEHLTKITRRIDGYLVAYACLKFSGELNPEHGRFAFQIKFAVFNEFSQRNDFFFLLGINAPHERCEPPVLKFYDHWALNEGCRCDNARCVVDLCFECPPITQDVLGTHENVCIEINHLLAQLAVESGHYRDDENQHRHAQHHPEHRDQCDDREKCALRFQIPQRQEKAKWQVQFAPSVAAKSAGFKRTRKLFQCMCS